MKTRIVRVGNSRGVRLPKLLLQQARLADEVELQVKPGRIVIRALRRPRAGWAEAARQAHERGDDKLLDPPTPTRFDRREWAWREGERRPYAGVCTLLGSIQRAGVRFAKRAPASSCLPTS